MAIIVTAGELLRLQGDDVAPLPLELETLAQLSRMVNRRNSRIVLLPAPAGAGPFSHTLECRCGTLFRVTIVDLTDEEAAACGMGSPASDADAEWVLGQVPARVAAEGFRSLGDLVDSIIRAGVPGWRWSP